MPICSDATIYRLFHCTLVFFIADTRTIVQEIEVAYTYLVFSLLSEDHELLLKRHVYPRRYGLDHALEIYSHYLRRTPPAMSNRPKQSAN